MRPRILKCILRVGVCVSVQLRLDLGAYVARQTVSKSTFRGKLSLLFCASASLSTLAIAVGRTTRTCRVYEAYITHSCQSELKATYNPPLNNQPAVSTPNKGEPRSNQSLLPSSSAPGLCFLLLLYSLCVCHSLHDAPRTWKHLVQTEATGDVYSRLREWGTEVA